MSGLTDLSHLLFVFFIVRSPNCALQLASYALLGVAWSLNKKKPSATLIIPFNNSLVLASLVLVSLIFCSF